MNIFLKSEAMSKFKILKPFSDSGKKEELSKIFFVFSITCSGWQFKRFKIFLKSLLLTKTAKR